MANQDNKSVTPTRFTHDEFILTDLYPDAKAHLMHNQPPIKEAMNNAIVAFDANALLFPYELNSHFYGEVVEKLHSLAKAKRLMIPAHALREFFKHRQGKLGEISQKINGMASKATTNIFSHKMSILEDDPEILAAKAKNKEFLKVGKELADLLKIVGQKIDGAEYGSDLLSTAYRDKISGSIFDIDLDATARQALISEAKLRFDLNIPPGYKDKAKKSGLGDLIIWKTILKNVKPGQNCIFVTDDIKADWYFKSEGPKSARAELVDEYRQASGGGSLYLCRFADFLSLIDASKELIKAASAALIAPRLAEIADEEAALELLIKEQDYRITSQEGFIGALKGAHNRYHKYGHDPIADAQVDEQLRQCREDAIKEESNLANLWVDVSEKKNVFINRLSELWREKQDLQYGREPSKINH